MKHLLFVSALCTYVVTCESKYKDVPCEWKSLTGLHFDLKPLIRKEGQKSYYIKDGDIPCTPEEEPTYSYLWNFCSSVTAESMPSSDVCDPTTEKGAVIQFLDRTNDDYKECHVIGRYDSSKDDLDYNLLDERNPTKGVSMTYPLGEMCPNGAFRSATIDVVCDNVDSVIESALEPDVCNYHMVMRSYYGCPKECPITKHGLCNSHGHCAFDSKSKKAYCYCNSGYSGSSCSDKDSSGSSDSYDGLGVQIGLLVTLLVITIALTGIVSFMIYRVTMLRKEKLLENAPQYSSLSGDGGAEMATF
mmetsp:Transcript_21421/g.31021  ORF Transcript_21421/g.31021 Transcript_21421/m.31021 type:complete len:303 (+) Transcript_21421:130-1038(+)|eukprot:CAMPEP_0185033986 /NCGR_PEP_ID=MMETSP1103-20130426/23454_1 /TAXON_ID=36769 /ORGANISM="Paraphysomonas bandaiensis, Strain Caron Lab Isolate" /LENGTH=302 /DNA_ID=CAMNT_0027570459 /DNA_START=68 /DNA_END=976 /DNA_ORIENTATION=-